MFKFKKPETQNAKILRILRKHPLKNIDMVNLGILSYTRRINELRQQGHTIITERIYSKGKATHTYQYVLVEE